MGDNEIRKEITLRNPDVDVGKSRSAVRGPREKPAADLEKKEHGIIYEVYTDGRMIA